MKGKTTLSEIELTTGVPNRTLSEYKKENNEIFGILELATVAKSLNYTTEDFLVITRIERVFGNMKHPEINVNQIFENGYSLLSKRGKTQEQKENIKLGMFCKILKLDKDILSAYKKVLERLKTNLTES